MDALKMGGQNDHFKRVFHGMLGLFYEADAGPGYSSLTPDLYFKLQQDKGDSKISKAEFSTRLTFAKMEAVLGKDLIKKFKDTDGDGDVDMADVWTTLDVDKSGDLTLEEFTYGLLDRPAAWKEVFEIMSEDGELDAEKLGDAIRAYGFNPSDAEVMEIANKYDTNADGKIDYGEWQSIAKGMVAGSDAELQEDIKKHFATLAKGEPTITTGELSHVCQTLGAKLDKEEADAMVKVVDGNGDGNVDAGEFMLMRGLPGASFEVTW